MTGEAPAARPDDFYALAQVRAALATKVSRERFGDELEKMITGAPCTPCKEMPRTLHGHAVQSCAADRSPPPPLRFPGKVLLETERNQP